MQKLSLQLSRVKIIGTHPCGNIGQEEFKRREYLHDVLYHRYYTERVVASFHTKFNLTTMVVIYLCPLKALN